MRPMHWACSRGQLTTARFLLTSGCSIDAPEGRGQTPLMIAAQGEHGVLLQWLVQRGAKLDAVDRDGDSAVHWAAYKDSRHALAALLEYELQPELADSYGSTALHLAVGKGAMSSVLVLLRHAALPAMLAHKDGKERTPAMLAEERGFAEIKARLESETPLTRVEHFFGEATAVVTGVTFGVQSRIIEWSSESTETFSRWFARQVGAEGASPAMSREMMPAAPP